MGGVVRVVRSIALHSVCARDESPAGTPATKAQMREHMPWTLQTMQAHAAEWGMPVGVVAVENGWVYRWEARNGG